MANAKRADPNQDPRRRAFWVSEEYHRMAMALSGVDEKYIGEWVEDIIRDYVMARAAKDAVYRAVLAQLKEDERE